VNKTCALPGLKNGILHWQQLSPLGPHLRRANMTTYFNVVHAKLVEVASQHLPAPLRSCLQ
jgi:hypothetical protein